MPCCQHGGQWLESNLFDTLPMREETKSDAEKTVDTPPAPHTPRPIGLAAAPVAGVVATRAPGARDASSALDAGRRAGPRLARSTTIHSPSPHLPMTFAGTLLPEFDQEMATTRRLLERVPAAKGPWKPHPKSFALGHLAQLVAWIPGWIASTVREPALD